MSHLRRALACASVLLVACTETPPLYPANASPEIVEACALTVRKCTACHDRDRILTARLTAAEWRDTVEEMRRIPGSAISEPERDIILQCLLKRTTSSARLGSPCFVAVR
jgi:hypothetical protein